jgi:hypothetical protein
MLLIGLFHVEIGPCLADDPIVKALKALLKLCSSPHMDIVSLQKFLLAPFIFLDLIIEMSKVSVSSILEHFFNFSHAKLEVFVRLRSSWY